MLSYVGPAELERIVAAGEDPVARARTFADACRLNVLSMVMEAGSGHLGTSFSCLDVLAWLHLEELQEGDRFFSSKGHDAPALYAVLAGLGRIDFEQLHRLRRLGGLPGHPDVRDTPGIVTNTGSLGMGIAKARGFVLADRLAGRSGRVYVLTGDGELQEGQFWESLQPTANQGIHEITVIVDHNKIQSDTWVDEVSALGDIEARVAAHGWAVGRCDGNDVAAVRDGLADLRERADGRPQLLIADTRKGAGVSFMEGPRLERSPHALYAFHSGAPSREDYDAAVAELRARLPDVALESAEAPQKTAGAAPEGLVAAYERALARLGDERDDVVVLSADLRLDCGLVTFAREHPERFFECGIAEQDMVSQAGTMALAGLVPLVHSFGCFLSTRPNEQIYNNTTEGTKVVYVGSLVGLVPGGPGHSHQSVRDISALAANPGMALIEPGSPAQVERALRWAVDDASGPVYIRLVTVPWELGFDLPDEPLAAGRGTVVRPGRDATIVTTGPVMLAQAWAAIAGLADDGLDVGLIALPWLKDVDGAWLAEHCEGTVFTLDNHYLEGGQGDAVLSALQAGAEAPPRVVKLGVDRVPVCGTNAEVLREHGVDAEGVRVAIRERVGAAIAR